MEANKAYTKEERDYHVQQWRQSGKSQKIYSIEAGIPVISLHYWIYGKKKKAEGKRAHSAFVSLRVEEEQTASLDVTVELPRGVRIILQGQVSAAFIRSLIS